MKKTYKPTEHEILREGISILINQIIKLQATVDESQKKGDLWDKVLFDLDPQFARRHAQIKKQICAEEAHTQKEEEKNVAHDVPLPNSSQEAALVSNLQDQLYTNVLGKKVPLDDKLNHPMGKPDIIGVSLTTKDKKSKK